MRNVLKFIWLVASCTLLIFVESCATVKPPEVVTSVRTVTVEKAIPVTCVDPAKVPPETKTAFPAQPADAARNADAASADLRSLVNENRILRALITPCLKVEPKQ